MNYGTGGRGNCPSNGTKPPSPCPNCYTELVGLGLHGKVSQDANDRLLAVEALTEDSRESEIIAARELIADAQELVDDLEDSLEKGLLNTRLDYLNEQLDAE